MTTCAGLGLLWEFVDEAEASGNDLDVVVASASVEGRLLSCRLLISDASELIAEWGAEFGGVIENRLGIGSSFWPEAVRTHPLLVDCRTRQRSSSSAGHLATSRQRSRRSA